MVAKPDGTWSAFDSNMNEIATGEVGPAGAIALGDTDGDGIDEVYGCDSEGCSIVAIDFDGDGLDEIARSTATTTLTAWGEVRTIAGAGVLSATDVDADGRLDLLSLEEATGTIVIHRGMAGTTAPPLALRTERAIFGPVFIGDANGDAISEIFSIDADGYLIHTSVESDANQVDEQGDTGGAEAANHTGR